VAVNTLEINTLESLTKVFHTKHHQYKPTHHP